MRKYSLKNTVRLLKFILLTIFPLFVIANNIDGFKKSDGSKQFLLQQFSPQILKLGDPGDSLSQNLKWRTAPNVGFVYRINNQEAQRVLNNSSPDSIFNGLLHTLIDTFEVEKGWTDRPSKGHFIMVRIIENKLHCEYTAVFPYQVFLLKEYDALALQVLDLEGNVRSDAKVNFGWKRIRIDNESNTYRLENQWVRRANTIVTVELDGFRSVFNVEKHEVPTWDNSYYDNNDDGPDFYSYLVTDKNRYKPNEKVRFKSYALSHSRWPLQKDLELWVNNGRKYTKLKDVSPHRPGSYADEFQLHDSLKLALDKSYRLELRDKRGRVAAHCHFQYEDYELHGNKLEVKLSSTTHFHPSKNQLSITATDVNGLILKDARATVVVKTNTIRETFQPLVILPDTLLITTFNLISDKATLFDIPSELFQKTNSAYNVQVIVLNSQNQRMEYMVSASHFFSQYEITTTFSNDSIIYSILKNGQQMDNVSMNMQRDEETEIRKVLFPFKERLNTAVSRMNIKGDFAAREIVMHNLIPVLELKGGIEKDSFKIRLNNPQQLDVSWFIYQGSALLKKGFGKELEYNTIITDRQQTFYVELLYSFGGQENLKRQEYQFRDDYLSVSLDIPERVYPGQKVDATIQVNDQLGSPVSGVDLTAFAVSAKLNYYPADLPYYGTSSSPRSEKDYYSKKDLNKRNAVLDLDYKKWVKLARLDTMKYYQFLYPGGQPFIYSLDITDTTQFAPFVVQGGSAKQVYVVEVNKQPVYFSWASHPKAYSFYIKPDAYNEISLRLYDRVLILDSICFDSGKKTILSIDLDQLPKGVKVIQLYTLPQTRKERKKNVLSKFTRTEIDRYSQYISSFRYTEGDAFLEGEMLFTPLFNSDSHLNKDIIAGPIVPGVQTYSGPPSLTTTYRHSGGFKYAFENNIVYKLNANNLIPDRLYNNSFSPAPYLYDLVITKNAFLSKTKYSSFKWHPQVIDFIGNGSRVQVLLPLEHQRAGIARFVFENCETKQFTSPCQEAGRISDLYFFEKGLHNAIVIFNNGMYLRMNSIDFRPYSNIVIDLKASKVYSKDSFSTRLLATPFQSCYSSFTTLAKSSSYTYSNSGFGNVRGTIYDDESSPLPGVTIVIKGTTTGTVTDVNGNFSLYIPENSSTLQVSFIGFMSQEIEVQIGSNIALYLESDVQRLQEVVVVGYGTQKKSNLTGAISGRVAGVSVSVPEEQIEVKEIQPENRDFKEAEAQLYQELLTLNHIRSNFSDVGFWEPKLFTNRHGQSKFTLTFPDDITRWDATVFAMNRQLKTGTLRKSIKAYKPIMAELDVPQFLTHGDSAFFLGKVLNYSSDKNISGKVKWVGTKSVFEKLIDFNDYHTDKLAVNVNSTDSITTSYLFTRDDGYQDGEERTVPVVAQGIIRADGSLSILKNNDEVLVKASDNENIIVEVLSNQLDVYAGEVKYLLNYQYDCNEQLASKLVGLVNHKLLMQYEQQPFRYDRDVNKIIERLLKNQNEEFLWSWWNVSSNTTYWMSAHILRALKVAKDAGYTVNLDINNITSKVSYSFDFLKQYHSLNADMVHALASWGALLDYAKYIQKLDSNILMNEYNENKESRKYLKRFSYMKEKLLLLEVRQMLKMPYERDSLLKYKKAGIMGEVFFSDNKPANYWYEDQLTANAIAYRIIKKDSILKDLILPMQMYFISQKKIGQWNTYESSNVLTSILPDLITNGAAKGSSASIKLGGRVNETVTRFPYYVELQPGEELHIKKESGLPIYYMQYVKERVTKAKTGVEGFEIKTSLGNYNNKNLEAGKPAQLIVEVDVKKEAHYENIMIEVPIPGSCSYADKRQNYQGVETHREYFKDRTVIFCENMKSGKYTFVINLLPRFTGKYLINPAQVSLMYVPVVNANTDMKKVKVE